MRHSTPYLFTLLLALFLLPLAAHAQQSVMHVKNAAGATLLNLNSNAGFSIGNSTTTSGYAMAMGQGATASGAYSVAMGLNTTASGQTSFAMGFGSVASNYASVAFGFSTEATGLHAVAIGDETIAASVNSFSIGAWNSANSTADNTAFVVGNGSSAASGGTRSDALVLDKDGNLTIAGSLTESSDRRLKEGIAPLGSVLQKLEGVEPVTFRFKEGTGHPTDPQIGLIAQDVQQAFPKLVAKGADGYLSVSYTKFTAVLLKAVQEQQAQIAALQARPAAGAPLAGMLPAAGLFLGVLVVGGVIAWRRRGPLG